MKMDWLRMETRLREALRDYQKDIDTGHNDTAKATLLLIDEIIADETQRGNELAD